MKDVQGAKTLSSVGLKILNVYLHVDSNYSATHNETLKQGKVGDSEDVEDVENYSSFDNKHIEDVILWD